MALVLSYFKRTRTQAADSQAFYCQNICSTLSHLRPHTLFYSAILRSVTMFTVLVQSISCFSDCNYITWLTLFLPTLWYHYCVIWNMHAYRLWSGLDNWVILCIVELFCSCTNIPKYCNKRTSSSCSYYNNGAKLQPPAHDFFNNAAQSPTVAADYYRSRVVRWQQSRLG